MADDETPNRWLIRRLARHGPIDADDQRAIAKLTLVTRTHEPGQYLLREGDRPKNCVFLLSGFVYRHKIVGDGGRQIVAIHIPGDLIDVQNILLEEADHNIQALTEAHVASATVEDLVELTTSRPAIGQALWRETLIDTSILREWVANVGRRDARTRTAHLLCELAVRCEAAELGTRSKYELPMTQEQLGDALGLTPVHVNRTLKRLEDDGLIRRNKRSVTVTNWDGLRRTGDFATAYLHGGTGKQATNRGGQ